MKIIKPYFEILTPIDNLRNYLKLIELAGRNCYKSESCITEESAEKFVSRICNVKKHESICEHSCLSVRLVADRAFLAEITRHRIAAYSVESQRYCSYDQAKFDSEVTFIEPFFFNHQLEEYGVWENSCQQSEQSYFKLIALGKNPEEARTVLPNCVKSDIIMSANFREWRHIFRLRCSETAHPQMRELMIPLRDKMHEILPELF
jgi:thymidylate synthase (FAD)